MSTTIDVNLGSSLQWTVSVFPSNRKMRWLSVDPLSGSGAVTVNVTADSTGLANGTYKTVLIFQSTDTQPEFVAVPVKFVVGNGGQGTPSVAAVVNGASFAGGALVPGEIATVFGSNITGTTGINETSNLPLPI